MEEQLLKDIKESYEMIMSAPTYTYERGKGTKAYCLYRIKVLRARLLEMQKNVEKHNSIPFFK